LASDREGTLGVFRAVLEPRRLLVWIYVGRLVVASANFAWAVSVARFTEPTNTLIAAGSFVIAMAFTAFSFVRTEVNRRRPGPGFLYVQFIHDLLLITSVVHITGGADSQFAAMYILVNAAAERILSMVDGVLLLVDAAEGPMPQTKFVLGKALRLGLRPIVLINKLDRPDQRAHAVHDEVFDLFAALGASDAQLDFPTLFASAREGWAATDPDGPRDEGMASLFELIRRHVRAPVVTPDGPFVMLATTLERDPHLGRLLTGRIESGRVRANATIKALARDGTPIEQTRIVKMLAFHGLERVALEAAAAGDSVALAGFDRATVADTLCDLAVETALPAQPIDPPTLAMAFSANDSPLAGQEGTKVTARLIAERLRREAEGNVAIRLSPTPGRDAFEVAGRGELQLAVLIETMRREGYELSIGRPRVLLRTDPETAQTL
jgi:GTP-binding protein